MDFPMNSMVMFHSYVKLPEGNHPSNPQRNPSSNPTFRPQRIPPGTRTHGWCPPIAPSSRRGRRRRAGNRCGSCRCLRLATGRAVFSAAGSEKIGISHGYPLVNYNNIWKSTISSRVNHGFHMSKNVKSLVRSWKVPSIAGGG